MNKRVDYSEEELQGFKNDQPKPEAQPLQGREPTVESLSRRLFELKDNLEQVLPAQISAEKFIRTTITAVTMNKGLLSADIESLLASTMKAAQDGLLCDGREAALVIFNAKEKRQVEGKSYTTDVWVKKVQYMPMVKGLLKALYNTNTIANISVHEVYENDVFDFQLGDDEKIVHKPHRGQGRGAITSAYAIVTFKNGAVQREVMNGDDLAKVRSVSKAKDGGPWADWGGEMARKSVLRRIIKYLPSTPEIERILAHDDENYSFHSTPNGDKVTPEGSGQALSALLEHTPEIPMEVLNTKEAAYAKAK